MRRIALGVALVLALATACSGSNDNAVAGNGATGGGGTHSGGNGGTSASGGAGGISLDGGAATGGSAGGSACDPPDMLFVLDRTMSMHRRPDGTPATLAQPEESKWWIAITAIEALTAKLDKTLRFGLELFPRDPGGNVCVTLAERIQGTTATNPTCEEGEILVSPKLSAATDIAGAIDPQTTRLCTSTPIGAAIGTATTELSTIKTANRGQYGILISDGQDTCDDALVLSSAQALAASGVKLYVIGFDAAAGTGVSKTQLNQLACAGQTAKGFPAPCTKDAQGNYTATTPDGEVLYLLAEDATKLTDALSQVASGVCCGCIQ
jgi:von Willebrand factor type A domain